MVVRNWYIQFKRKA